MAVKIAIRNQDEWQELLALKLSLQIFLGGQGYWGYIDDSIPAPEFYEELEKYQKWHQVNAKIVSVILKVESQGLSVAMEMFEYL